MSEIPEFSVHNTKTGFKVRYVDPGSGRVRRLRLWADDEGVSPSRQSKREAMKRAPEVIRSEISMSQIKEARQAGKIVTLGQFFERAVQDPGTRGRNTEATQALRQNALGILRIWLRQQGYHDQRAVAELARDHFDRYTADRMKGGLATPSGRSSKPLGKKAMERELQILKRAFNFMLEDDEIEGVTRNPVKAKIRAFENVDERRTALRDRSISDEQVQILLENCDSTFEVNNRGAVEDRPMTSCYMHTVLMVLSETGLRPGELMKAKWSAVDWANGVLQITEGKTGSRKVVLDDALLDYLRDRLENLQSVGLNPKTIICKEDGTAVPVQSVMQAFRRYRDRLGLPQSVVLYGLRHRYAHRLSHKLTMPIVAAAMGHTDYRTTSLYTHTEVESVADQIRDALAS